jgi:Flp pilus assembly protein CpaB
MTQSSPSRHNAPETTPGWNSPSLRRAPYYLAVAILLAVLAGLATYAYLDQVRQQSVPTGIVIVVRREVRPGEIIGGDMIEARSVPKGILPQGALTDPSQATGRRVVVPLAVGEMLLSSKLASPNGGGLSAQLPDGRWAMVLPAGWLVGPLPEIVSGDRLDLLGYPSGASTSDAGLVVSDVEVLGVHGDQSSPDRLILAVTMDEALAVVYARSNGLNMLGLLRPGGL